MSIEAAKRANVKRFIIISSFDTTREAIQSASDSFAPYVVAKHYADEWLRATDLQHTIIHPGRLTNDEGTGKIEAASTVERNEVSREDIAEVILTCLENNHTIGKEMQIVNGNTPIKQSMNDLEENSQVTGMTVPGIFLYTPIITNTCTYFLLKNWFYVNCWGEIKISLQFITLFGFHSGGNFSLSAGG